MLSLTSVELLISVQREAHEVWNQNDANIQDTISSMTSVASKWSSLQEKHALGTHWDVLGAVLDVVLDVAAQTQLMGPWSNAEDCSTRIY